MKVYRRVRAKSRRLGKRLTKENGREGLQLLLLGSVRGCDRLKGPELFAKRGRDPPLVPEAGEANLEVRKPNSREVRNRRCRLIVGELTT